MTPHSVMRVLPPQRDLAVEFMPMPTEIEGIWRDLIPDALPFVPPSIREITLTFDADNNTALARTRLQPDYRRATLVLCPGVLPISRPERLLAVLHELAHVWSGDFRVAARSLLKLIPAGEDGIAGRACEGRIDHEEERFVEDLGHLFLAISQGRIPARVEVTP